MKKRIVYLRSLIIILGISMMIFGIYRGELKAVVKKAVNICLECVGIG